MTERPIPKGVSLDTLRDIVAGWAAVGAADEPQYTSDVAEATGISDAVGRQTRFLEAVDVLESEGQHHVLTEAGAPLAQALDSGATDEAREHATDLLGDWTVTDELYGLLRRNQVEREQLERHLAAITDHDHTNSRVSSGVGTLLDLYEWAGLLDRDDEDRCRIPEARRETKDEVAELRRELDAMRADLSDEIAAVRDETRETSEQVQRALERSVAAANEDIDATVDEAARGLVRAIVAAESGVEQALESRPTDGSPEEQAGEGADTEAEALTAEPESSDAVGDVDTDGGSSLDLLSGETDAVTVDRDTDTVRIEADGSTFELSPSGVEIIDAGEADGGESDEGSDAPAEAAAGRPSTSRAGEDAIALSLDLALDTDTDDVEDLVRGLRRALVDEMLSEED
ncbi:hypothetical protein BRD04_05035 [Halobacteriales archaeon QS_9_67_17]|nr:MAG: hypothetical protein BRD04_05035 [Halobacteriales archaeon QS_9_67_17]